MARKMKDSGIEWIGEVPNAWKINRIKNSFFIVSGATPNSEYDEFWDGNIPWITPADYKTKDKYVSYGRRNLSLLGYNSCGSTLVPTNSLVFSKRAPIGAVAITNRELCTNQGCLCCVPKNKANTIFYYYVLSVFTEQFELLGSGTTFKEIQASVFSNFYVPYPKFSEQQSIADFLDTQCSHIDSVIEKTRAAIEEYKKLKQAVITQAVTKGIRPNREMKDSEIEWVGEIPQDWNFIISRFLIEQIGDVDHYMPISANKGIPYVMTGDLKKFISEINFEKCKKITETDYDSLCVKIKPSVGDVIFARYATIGTVCYVDKDEKCIISYSCVTIKPNKKQLDGKYLFYYLQSSTFIEEVGQLINSNTQGNVGIEALYRIRIPQTTLLEQSEIVAYIDEKTAAIDSLIQKKEQLNTELEAYKKSLIYEYVTGKKEVVL